MPNPQEALVVAAIGKLQIATTASEIATASAELASSLGFACYIIVDVRGNRIDGIHHNAPALLRREVEDLGWLRGDTVCARLRSSPIPLVWDEQGAGDWRRQHGDLGYRSGVAAASWDGGGGGCMLLLSGPESRLADEDVHVSVVYALMAVTMLSGPIKQLAARPRPACPLSERELLCLKYAAAGFTSKVAASALGISVRTVDQYLERAREKLQVSTTLAASTTAIRHGWLDLEEALDLAA